MPEQRTHLDFHEVLSWRLCNTEDGDDTSSFQFEDVLNVDALDSAAFARSLLGACYRS